MSNTRFAVQLALTSSLSLALVACVADDGDLSLQDVTSAAQGGGGGGGGGGRGGGGTPKPGAIRTVSGAAPCDDGTVLSVTLSKGFDSRVEMQMVVAAGLASPPSGYLNVRLEDATSGAFVNGFGSWPQALLPGMSITNLGRTVPVGESTLAFSAVVHDGTSAAAPALVSCATSITVLAR